MDVNRKQYLQTIAPEILTSIATLLSCADINAVRLCCKQLDHVLGPKNASLWKTKFLEIFDHPMQTPGNWYSHLAERLRKPDKHPYDIGVLLTIFRESTTPKNGTFLNKTIVDRDWVGKVKLPLSGNVDHGLRLLQIFTGFPLALPLQKMALSELDPEFFDVPQWEVLYAITAYCHSKIHNFSTLVTLEPAIQDWWECCLGFWCGINVALKPEADFPSPSFVLDLREKEVKEHALNVEGRYREESCEPSNEPWCAVKGQIRLFEEEGVVYWDLRIHDERKAGGFSLIGYQPAPGRVVVSGLSGLFDSDGDYESRIFSFWPAKQKEAVQDTWFTHREVEPQSIWNDSEQSE
ncbi:uncharacterized protein PV07_12684 [Cladophialophora immunda]|uniref:F-box domain-containing protein n=1 Tax=Cladophialophora immunda TaxID=569365 RepID=A0A0D1Z2P3_9EURO|nr:uncharacterized protein PV07_12684 [Cladophialophora immunda]KIW21906.1 hypothetical protein PV07_12684 [Cladophialophora immunda]